MTEGETLYRNILLEPDNDYHRLVYADWLEDQGDSDRAEYIRAAVELASDDAPHCPYGIGQTHDCSWVRNEPGLVLPCRLHELTRLMRRVPQSCRDAWFGSLLRELLQPSHVEWERGFPTGITCNAEQFIKHRGELFSRHPITSVRLADKRPLGTREGFWVWQQHAPYNRDDESSLPLSLFSTIASAKGSPGLAVRVVVFNSPEDAETALSDACVQLGRESARRLIGLPEMTRATF